MSSQEMREFQNFLYEEIIIKQISRHNSPQISQKCISTLLRIVNNILEDPYNEKFRKLPEKNKLINSNILQIIGGREFLVKIGFKSKVLEFEKFFILESKNTAPVGKDDGKKIRDELFLTRQLERLEIAQKLLEDYLKKVTDHAEAVRRMQEKEKRAEELQKAAVLENIKEDKERRQKQQIQLKLRRQLEKEAQRHEEKLDVNEENAEFEQQQLEQSPFYRPYHHSHFEQKKN
ncbi:hypothetical protein RclHR1_17940004 [Rhizophagus clarus]|uniref:PUB domain-containing protein n=1 Tax=Rhizophagus clarus TaxID=94130 RepID=A0A2Z6R1J6_9GLOM|nr:hypothetical protein RclHR1_17940004 [Rhizophagus clarus]